jgi:hypothetical protein
LHGLQSWQEWIFTAQTVHAVEPIAIRSFVWRYSLPDVEIRCDIAPVATAVIACRRVIDKPWVEANAIADRIWIIDVSKRIEPERDTLNVIMPCCDIWIARAEVILQRSAFRTKAKRLCLDAIAATYLRNNSDQVAARYRV